MKYSLNTIIERLNFKIPSAEKSLIYNRDENRFSYSKSTIDKIGFFEKIFLVTDKLTESYREKSYLPSTSAINSFYNNSKKPSYWRKVLINGFHDPLQLQQLFNQIKKEIWEREISSAQQKELFMYRKDIFGDFRYDSVTHKTIDDKVIKIIETLLESNSENAFIYVIFLFILIAIFHEDINKSPMSIVLTTETIEAVSKIKFDKKETFESGENSPLITLNKIETSEYVKTFDHPQYKKFAIYLYNDFGEFGCNFCSGNIVFEKNGVVKLDFKKEGSSTPTVYVGKANIFEKNDLVHITLEHEKTHRGAIICFHYTEFYEDPTCYLRKGLFISTTNDSHHRPSVRNIILLHKACDQSTVISGLLKCSDMRRNDGFIIIRKKNLSKFLTEINNLNLIKQDMTIFTEFFDRQKSDLYYIIHEDEFSKFLNNECGYLEEVEQIKIILLLKSFSELPNSIYPYKGEDETYCIFKN